MRAFELAGAVDKLFNCISGEPRGWTCYPPRQGSAMDEEVPDDKKLWYATFAWQSRESTDEKQLVRELYRSFEAMRKLCTQPDPLLLWRSLPRYVEERQGRVLFRRIRCRLVIPEIAFGERREKWLSIPGYKAECEPYPEVK